MHQKCMEAWQLQLISRCKQQQYISTLYFNACAKFLLHLGCSHLLILVQETSHVFHVFLRFFVGDDGGQTSRGGEMSAPIAQPEFL